VDSVPAIDRRDSAPVAGLLKSSAIYGAGAILPRALSLVLLPMFTRYLAPAEYAIVSIGVVVTAVLTLIYPLGMHGSLGRLYFTVSVEERSSLLATTWGTVAVCGITATVILSFLGPVISPHVFHHVAFNPYLHIAIWTAFFTSLTLVPLALLQAQQRPIAYVAVSTLTAVCSTLGAAVLVMFYDGGAAGYLKGALGGSVVSAVACIAIFARDLNVAPTRKLFRAAAAFGLPLVPHGLAGWALSLSDRIILEHNVALADLGRYSIAFQISSVISFVAVAVNAAWSPELFRRYREDRTVEGMMRSTTYYVVGMVWLAVSAGVLASPAIRILASAAYVGADRLIPWLAVGFLLNALYFVPVNFIMLHSRTAVIPVLTGISAVLNIALNLWLVPRYGVTAAAISTAVSYGVCLVLTLVVAWRIQPVRYEARQMLVGVLVALTVAVIALQVTIPGSALAEAVARGGILASVPLIFIVIGRTAKKRPFFA
jgi:O-antigen/teichoic acid export membrane protein